MSKRGNQAVSKMREHRPHDSELPSLQQDVLKVR